MTNQIGRSIFLDPVVTRLSSRSMASSGYRRTSWRPVKPMATMTKVMTNQNRSECFYRSRRDMVNFKVNALLWLPVNIVGACQTNGADDEVGQKGGEIMALMTTWDLLISSTFLLQACMCLPKSTCSIFGTVRILLRNVWLRERGHHYHRDEHYPRMA
ncbi:hypothetical protein X801_06118 [Opisthorchis viverrini]|uniref:Uncharacterized protein n=1 Tax=Opisthorchis viverrini TaxID=6198 RepID=A0A1S8WUN2_OPIVI|nr:hypothetical protein X801_06118 [Opisthorchis viverrini]